MERLTYLSNVEPEGVSLVVPVVKMCCQKLRKLTSHGMRLDIFRRVETVEKTV